MRIKFEDLKKDDYVYVKAGKDNIKVKPYLTMDEISAIVNDISDIKNVVDRQCTKDLHVLTLCTDIENLKNDDTLQPWEQEPVDMSLYYEYGIVEKVVAEIKNYNDIEMFLERNYNISMSLSTMLGNIDKYIDRFVTSIELLDEEKLQEVSNSIMSKIDKGTDVSNAVSNSLPKILKEITEKSGINGKR